MAIKPVERRSVSSEVLEQIKQQIISGEWATGTKIPGELELGRMFGVSRVSIREAIHRLVGMGVLCIRRGEGTFVNEMLTQDYFQTLLPILMIDGASLKDMMEFRAMIEIESARLAAARAELADIERLRAILANMDKYQGDYKRFAAEDLNFHTALAMATHNSVVVKINAIIHDMLKKTMEEIVSLTGFEGGIYYHRKILEAIENRDEAAAVRTMKEHIDVTINKVIKK